MFKKLLLLACVMMALPTFGQKKNFKAACLNVDGLPPSISIIGINLKLNPEGPQETGTTRMSELIAQKGWDVFAVSENFNYNTQLMSQISGYYNTGTYRGEVSTSNTKLDGKLKVNTDGLNLLWKKSLKASGETYIKWNKTNGYTDQGSDELIMKGARYYCVQIANGLEVDVYIHHMDAETNDADIAARESQITQLVDVILASQNRRPIIIMGDSNCRYTRDRLKELMFDRINADPRFEIHDPWVDFQWGGNFPALGSDALMTHTWGHQKGEVVDKIFYINNTDADGVTLTANSYLHDADFSYPDGSPISDHYPIVIDFTIENTSDNITTGQYYFRNIATGKLLRAGANWGTHAILGETGNCITLENAGAENAYLFHTTCGYLSHEGWMDSSSQDSFTITKNDDGLHTITFDNGTKALAADESMMVNAADADASSPWQLWEVLTHDDLVKELYNATETSPCDATFFIKGADFSRNDSAQDAWQQSLNSTNISLNKGGIDGDVPDNNFLAEFYNKTGSSYKKSGGTLTQTVSGLPNGRYKVSVQAFTRRGNENFKITANGTSIPLHDIAAFAQDEQIHSDATLSSGKYVPNTMASAAAFFNRGFYTSETEITISDHQLTILVNKPHTTSETWFCFDNFRLTYLGETAEELALYEKVKRAIDDAAAKAEAMGYYNYSNHVVEERYELRNIVGDGEEEVRMTYIALANAAKSQNAIPADMRYVIFNNSFEMGGLDYWTVSGNASVSENASSLDADGIFTLQTSGETEISQSTETFGITLPNGIYELKALLSDGATLTANGYESSPAAGGNPLSVVSLRFPVENGTASFGAKGNSFTADNFTLTRLADADNMVGYEKVRAAMADATARTNALGAPYADGWDLSSYQAILDSFTLEGDGTEEFNEIYALLRERVILHAIELGENADLTDAITNPSFELGKPWGWNVIYSSDTGVMPNSNDTYYADGCHGDYLFNTWWQGTPVTQTINGLPAGHYRLTAKVASDNNAGIYLTANGEKELKTISGDDDIKKTFFDIAVEFDLAAGEPLTIGAVGSADDGEHTFLADGYWWYKVDDFRLVLISATVPERTVTLAFEGEYDTLILPFDHEIPSGLEVYSVPGYASEGNDHKVLSLEQTDVIAANTPYVVRQSTRSAVYEFTGIPVNESDTYTHGLLTGTHVDTVAEEGHFVLSHTTDGSLFRRLATGESTSVTAGHAFISDPDSAVSFLRFTDNGGSTGLEVITVTDNADVDIYNAAGILLFRSVPCAEALRSLAPGIYLIRQGTNVFKIAI